MTRNKFIQRIHVLKRDLGLDDETYRTVLDSVAGKTSCTNLEEEELNLVLLALEKMSRGGNGATSVTLRNQRQQRFIARLMDYLGWTWKQTSHFCVRQTGKRSTRSCNAAELSKVIIGMIRLIDEDIEKGRLKLSPEKLEEYRRYTKMQRGMNDEPTCKHERSIDVPGNFCWKCGREYDTPTDHHLTEGATT